jgi:curved DNA-binding protein CbpA
VLGVSHSSSDEEIKTAFRNLAKRFHPDAQSGRQGKDDSSASRFREISSAYEKIRTSTLRAAMLEEMYGSIEPDSIKRWGRRNYTDIGSEFSNAQQKIEQNAQNRWKMKWMYRFERLIHPRTLLIVIPGVFLTHFAIKSFLSSPDPKNGGSNKLVSTNKNVGKWEKSMRGIDTSELWFTNQKVKKAPAKISGKDGKTPSVQNPKN